jgi:excisionase family DNA binding protein
MTVGATSDTKFATSGGESRQRDQMFHTIEAVAGLLAVSTRTVHRSIRRNELAAHKFGRAVRIADSDLGAFIAQRRYL